MKKKLFYLFLIITICFGNFVLADGYVEVDDQSRGTNPNLSYVTSDTYRVSGMGGTVYHVNVEGQTFDLYLNAGETISNSTVVAGYANGNVPAHMNGEPKDVAALCRANRKRGFSKINR